MKTPERTIPPGMLAKIHAVRRRRWLMEMGSVLLFAIALGLGLVAVATAVDWRFAWSHPLARWAPLVVVLGVFGAAMRWLIGRMELRRPVIDEASEIDRALPGLEERWSTVSELSESKQAPALLGSPELIAQVGSEAESFVPRVRAAAVVPAAKLERPIVAVVAGCAVFAAVALVLSAHFPTLIQRLAQPWKATTLTRIEMTPVATRVIRDDAMEIGAQLSGKLTDSATLILRDPRGGERSIVFPPASAAIKHRIAQITEPFAFQIRAGDAATPWVSVNMVDRPMITKLAMRIVPPAYTKREVAVWDALPQTARALRGSQLAIEFTTDQPLASAAIEFAKTPAPEKSPLEPTGERAYHFTMTLEEVVSFSLLLQNDIGLRSLAAECRIEIDEDQPPTVEILETSESVVLSAADKLRVDFEATDDFGVAKAELVATIEKPGQAAQEVTMPIDLGKQAGEANVKSSVEIDLKRYQIDAQTKFSYAVRVQDNRGADAQNRKGGGPNENKMVDAQNSQGNSPESKNDAQSPDGKPSEKNGTDAQNPQANSPESKNNAQAADGKAGGEKKEASPAMTLASKGRTLDIEGQTCTPPKAVRIEQFARRTDRETVDKTSIAIDPVLKKLRETAAEALASTESALDGLTVAARLDSIREEHAHAALVKVGEGVLAVAALKKESAETPYAFFAVQADALVSGGLLPAAKRLQAALKAKPAKPDVEAAAVHLRWLVETLDSLTRQYATLKSVKKTEEMMREIKEMHLAFVEDLPEWLKQGGNSAYQRSLMEVDAAYAKAYEEMLKKRRDVMMRLAALLENEPELAARFLDQTSKATNIFRDELLRLRWEQDELVKVVAATETGADGNRALAAMWRARLRQSQEKAAAAANRDANEAKVWMPKEIPETQREQIHRAALSAASSARAAAAINGDARHDERGFQLAMETMDRYETALGAFDRDSDYGKNRREDLEKLRRATRQNRDFAQLTNAGRFADAIFTAQSALNAETSTIAGLLLQATLSLERVSAEADEAAKSLKTVLIEKVTTPQHTAEVSLKGKAYAQARTSQYTVVQGLAQAVEVLDDFMQKAIKKLDEAKAAPAPPMAPSFEDLLASLERERRETFSLGISCRKPNIQIETDMQRKQKSNSENQSSQGQKPGSPKPEPGNDPAQRAETASEKHEREQRMEASREAARESARQAAVSQQAANERAKRLSEEFRSQTIEGSAPGVAKSGNDKEANWNTLPSELRANLLQERGRTPPKRYESAIEQYFKTIAAGDADKPARKP